jgi:hypothetical protein
MGGWLVSSCFRSQHNLRNQLLDNAFEGGDIEIASQRNPNSNFANTSIHESNHEWLSQVET